MSGSAESFDAAGVVATIVSEGAGATNPDATGMQGEVVHDEQSRIRERQPRPRREARHGPRPSVPAAQRGSRDPSQRAYLGLQSC